jgi:hypothetical protein
MMYMIASITRYIVASRMESTGQRGKIQISETTAALLIEAGKEHWLKRRQDAVSAKGKVSQS